MIRISVSRLSRKILIAEYPSHEKSGTIIAGSHSLLYRQMAARLPLRDVKDIMLSETIDVVMSGIIHHPSHDDLRMVGIMIHQEHVSACMRWIQATVSAGHTASHGIRTLYEHYDLDDDDFNQETVRKKWQRYLRRSIDLLHKPKSSLLETKGVKKLQLPDENRFAIFIADIVEMCYDSTHRWDHQRIRDLRIYHLCRHNTYSLVGDHMGMSMRTVQSIDRRISEWMHRHKVVRSKALLLHS